MLSTDTKPPRRPLSSTVELWRSWYSPSALDSDEAALDSLHTWLPCELVLSDRLMSVCSLDAEDPKKCCRCAASNKGVRVRAWRRVFHNEDVLCCGMGGDLGLYQDVSGPASFGKADAEEHLDSEIEALRKRP